MPTAPHPAASPEIVRATENAIEIANQTEAFYQSANVGTVTMTIAILTARLLTRFPENQRRKILAAINDAAFKNVETEALRIVAKQMPPKPSQTIQ